LVQSDLDRAEPLGREVVVVDAAEVVLDRLGALVGAETFGGSLLQATQRRRRAQLHRAVRRATHS
jgi:hypothetical protein